MISVVTDTVRVLRQCGSDLSSIVYMVILSECMANLQEICIWLCPRDLEYILDELEQTVPKSGLPT